MSLTLYTDDAADDAGKSRKPDDLLGLMGSSSFQRRRTCWVARLDWNDCGSFDESINGLNGPRRQSKSVRQMFRQPTLRIILSDQQAQFLSSRELRHHAIRELTFRQPTDGLGPNSRRKQREYVDYPTSSARGRDAVARGFARTGRNGAG